MAGRKRETTEQARKQSMASLVLVVTAVLVLLVMVGIQAIGLREKTAAYKETKASLEKQIADEEARTERINAYREYIKTDTFIEQMARERLGLIKDSQLLFYGLGSDGEQEDAAETDTSSEGDTGGDGADDTGGDETDNTGGDETDDTGGDEE